MKTFRHSLSFAVALLFLFAATPSVRAQNCQAWFMYSVDTLSNPNVLTLSDSSYSGGGTITSWQWTVNGSPVGTNGPNQSLNMTVLAGDVICLTITTDSGCNSTWCDSVYYSLPCNGTVHFTYTHDSLNNYFFTPTLTGMNFPVTYYWYSNNGPTSTQATFTTQFNTAGFYSVCLNVSDVSGCSYTFCDSIGALAGAGCQGCVPNIYYTVDSLNPNMYTFYDTTTYLNTPTNDTWTVNGVNSGSGNSITRSLVNAGTYSICHNVTVSGCSGSCPHSNCISVVVQPPPSIQISYFNADSNNVFCTAPQAVNFYLYGSVTGYTPGDTTIGIHINFGDGTDTSFLVVHYQTYFYSFFTHGYQNPGSYTPQVIVYSPDSLYSDTALSQDPIVITNTCGPVSGHVYLDNNSNCIFDAGDTPLAWRGVYISDGAGIYHYTYTDSSGFYSFNVPSGPTYTITVTTSGNWSSGQYVALCPASGSISVTSVPSSSNNFFLYCPPGFDLSTYVYGWGFVPGRTGSICVYVHNSGCTQVSGQVQLVLDPRLTALPDSSGQYTVNGDTVTWNLNGGPNGYYQSLCVSVTTSVLAQIGDTICVTATALPVVGDSVPSNNVATHCWPVRTSFDPNDKTADPVGVGAAHAIRPETALTYTIGFQNTGTATAQDIYILDPLDANLDVNTLQVLATSHPVEPAVLTGNVLRFTYNNINLPDSNANEPMSHGYVTYSISPNANVPNGAIIQNTAAIYFDFNPAVMTNTTSHTVDFFLAVHQPEMPSPLASIYPNPAKDRLFVKLVKPGRAEVKLYDVTGRIVMHSTLTASGVVDVQSLHAGTYNVQVIQDGQVQNALLFLVK